MSTASIKDEGEAGLLGEGHVHKGTTARRTARCAQGTPRVVPPGCIQVRLRPVDLDALLGSEHPARTVRAFVQAMDLTPPCACIGRAGSHGSAAAINPAMLEALWL